MLITGRIRRQESYPEIVSPMTCFSLRSSPCTALTSCTLLDGAVERVYPGWCGRVVPGGVYWYPAEVDLGWTNNKILRLTRPRTLGRP